MLIYVIEGDLVRSNEVLNIPLNYFSQAFVSCGTFGLICCVPIPPNMIGGGAL